MKKTRFEKDPYNKVQNFLYNRALHGLSIYTEKEIAEMHFNQKKRILKIQKKTQKVINLWKQEITNGIANEIFMRLFPTMEITKSLVCYYGVEGDVEHVNKLTFKDLNIQKDHIIDKLIACKILPKNFKSLEVTYDTAKEETV
jgi:hypothetical protein